MKFIDAVMSGRADWLAQWQQFTADKTGRPVRDIQPAVPYRRRGLPGSRLKALLAGPPFWIKGDAGCRCDERAAQMDRWGVAGCREHRDEIVGWLAERATAKGWPFAHAGAAVLVDTAIRLAAADEEAA